MAQPTETFDSYDAVSGIHEDLQDVIYRVSPTETPLLSLISQTTAQHRIHEWLIDSLDTPSADNAGIEGDDVVAGAIVAPGRRGNYTQISRKAITISGTEEAVNTAGRDSEIAYQLMVKGLALRRDMDSRISQEDPAVIGTASVARQTAGFEAWITTNDSRGATGADPTLSGGIPDAGPTDGTQRNFTEALAKDVLRQIFTNSNTNGVTVIAGPVNKMNFSSQVLAGGGSDNRFMPVRNQQNDLWAAFDVYHSDFGLVRVLPSRHTRERSMLFVNPEFWSVAYLRRMHTVELAKTGDAEKRMIQSEYALVARNEASSGVLADLNTAVL